MQLRSMDAFWMLLLIVLLNISNGFFVIADNLALLSGTLRTYQRAACDDDMVTLTCPPGTSISIEVAQYGKSAPSKTLCVPKSTQSPIVKPPHNYNTSCLWPNALQNKWDEVTDGSWEGYSLLQTVIEACQKKRQCKFHTSPKTFGGDPCPGVPKYVEIAYKCRPYEFRSKVACENERIQLKCNPNSRVAVYSASYGRTEYESIHCPQPQGVPEETCLVSYATEIVMQRCHGKRLCDLSADINTFGSPCKPESRMYLKVVFTCVPRKVLKEQGSLESDEIEEETSNTDEEELEPYDAANEYIRESTATPASNLEEGAKHNLTKGDFTKEFKPPLHDMADVLAEENRGHLLLYLIISIASAIVLILTVLILKLFIQRHRVSKEDKFAANNISDQTLPNGFTDDISEVDADIDLTTPLPLSLPSVTIHSPSPMIDITEDVRFPHIHRHTMCRTFTDIEAPPRSISSASSTQYYYG